MIAVYYTESETGTKISCPLCKMKREEWYGLEPENDAERKKLEEKLGDIASWLVCAECLETAEQILGCEIRLVTAEDAAKLADEQLSETVPEGVAEYIKAVADEKCPFCGQPAEVKFEYLPKSENWGAYLPFRRVILSCSSCGSVKKTAPRRDEPLGSFVMGTILGFVIRVLWGEVAPPPPSLVPGDIGIQVKEEETLVLEHQCDPVVLGTFKTAGELVEILVIGNKAIKVEG